MMNETRIPLPPVVTLCLLFLSTMMQNAMANESSWPETQSDFAVLPKYCLYKFKGKQYPAQAEKWEKILGHNGWVHIHHYCYGMHALYNAKLSMNPKEKENWLEIAFYQWDYVDKNWKKTFKLRPELHVKRGETYLTAGNATAALSEFKKAIALKPDYSVPYVRIADYFRDSGDKEEALRWIRKGLKAAPKSRKLKRRLDALK